MSLHWEIFFLSIIEGKYSLIYRSQIQFLQMNAIIHIFIDLSNVIIQTIKKEPNASTNLLHTPQK